MGVDFPLVPRIGKVDKKLLTSMVFTHCHLTFFGLCYDPALASLRANFARVTKD